MELGKRPSRPFSYTTSSKHSQSKIRKNEWTSMRGFFHKKTSQDDDDDDCVYDYDDDDDDDTDGVYYNLVPVL